MTGIQIIEDASEVLHSGETYWRLKLDGFDQMTGWIKPELGQYLLKLMEIDRVMEMVKGVAFGLMEALKGGVK